MSEVKDLTVNLRAIEPENIASIKNRDPKYLESDKAFVRTLAQAAINVELFTIPLYMTAMYSIVGMHQINTKGSDFYEGRWWPGLAPSSTPNLATDKNPSIANQHAFNNIFSVFMEEMLHLQLASNIAAKLGVKPSFTSPALQSKENAWLCYTNTKNPKKPNRVIPHIIDFNDCKKPYSDIKVELGPLDENRVELFIAIEEPLNVAEERIKPEVWKKKYAHQAPYNDWQPCNNENDLPLFGSIGKMYETLWAYCEIEYTDGTTLLSELSKGLDNAFQRDQFNTQTPAHPMKEFPHIAAKLGEYSSEEIFKIELLNVISAITDQGEGQGIVSMILEMWDKRNTLAKHVRTGKSHFMPPHGAMPPHMKAVQQRFQPDADALMQDYKGYNDKGQKINISGQAKARIDMAALDHFETFQEVKKWMAQEGFLTWDKWHKEGNKWDASMLQEEDKTQKKYNIPSAQEVAEALNELKKEQKEYFELLSQAAVGTLKGVTTALNSYWNQASAEFPNPAMTGSGDRISICWAATGKAPDLTKGIGAIDTKTTLYNACQGMSLMKKEVGKDMLPDVRIYHSCKGSNECKTQGGCGYVQSTNGGGQCGTSTQVPKSLKSAPANNKCGTLGGCAVPISASQLFPKEAEGAQYKMQLFSYEDKAPFTTTAIKDPLAYEVGEPVYDIAWKAYCEALKQRGEKQIPKKPKAHPLRVALPPST